MDSVSVPPDIELFQEAIVSLIVPQEAQTSTVFVFADKIVEKSMKLIAPTDKLMTQYSDNAGVNLLKYGI